MRSERWLSLFLVIIISVLIYNYFGNETQNTAASKKAITFSEFIRQVKQGNVLDANIQGKQLIEGQFVDSSQYYTYMPPSYPQLVDLLRKTQSWYLLFSTKWLPLVCNTFNPMGSLHFYHADLGSHES